MDGRRNRRTKAAVLNFLGHSVDADIELPAPF